MQYIHSPFGDGVQQTKSPFSRLPLENDLTICFKTMLLEKIFRLYDQKSAKFLH